MSSIVVDGYNINYKISGSGEKTAVILEGWGTNINTYDFVAGCISDRYRVVQFEFPGFGSSDEPKEAWNVDAFTDFFVKLMESLEIDEATLIGHSFGGRVIIKLAARENIPFKIRNIVLIDSAGILPKKTPAQQAKIRRYKIMKKIVSNKLIYMLFQDMIDDWKSRQGSADYRAASEMMKKCLVMAVNEDLTELLPRVKQDVLLIWGDLDTATPIADAKLMEERMPSAGLAVIEGTGHFCFVEQPGQFRGIINSYL